MSTIPFAGRLALVLLALALAAPAQAQELFFQSCMTSAGADLPPGVAADALCGCATQRSLQAGTAPADLDALVDYVADDRSLDQASVPERLQPALSVAGEALMGCVLQVGMAGMMEAAMSEAMTAAASSEALAEALAETAPDGAAPADKGGVPAQGGIPAELMAVAGAPGPPPAAAPTVTPDGTVASAPTPRSERTVPDGFRTGAGQPVQRATQASKGAVIRILE